MCAPSVLVELTAENLNNWYMMIVNLTGMIWREHGLPHIVWMIYKKCVQFPICSVFLEPIERNFDYMAKKSPTIVMKGHIMWCPWVVVCRLVLPQIVSSSFHLWAISVQWKWLNTAWKYRQLKYLDEYQNEMIYKATVNKL